MKLHHPKLWIAMFSAAAVGYFVLSDLGRTAPGPLTGVHARVPKLSGWRSCSQCHGGLLGTMTDSCLECHTPIGAQITSGAGVHGSLPESVAKHCARCHSEHHGARFPMVNRLSFAQAGFQDIASFDHAVVGFPMDGPHLSLTCDACHVSATTRILPEGASRYLGLDRACATCHASPHVDSMSRKCADCHVQVDFDSIHAAEHAKWLPLIGAHARAGCRDCHAKDSPHALERYGGGHRPAARTCVSCHDSPHTEAFVLGNAKLQSVVPGQSCAGCHKPEHTSFRDPRLTIDARQHAESGFRIDVPHDQLGCDDCHSPLRDYAQRYPGRGQDSCENCHGDPHRGQFRASPLAENGCVDCHLRDRFIPHTFTSDRHAQTPLPLTGRHLDTDCNNCHTKSGEEPRKFRGVAKRCEACHEDGHAGFFEPFAAELAKQDGGTCARCHDTHAFGKIAEGSFEHGRWTGFALDGAHGQERCETCHPRRNEPDKFGRTFGRSAARFGPIQDSGRRCTPCHEDPHGGRFDNPALPATIEGRLGCARCHVQTSFRAVATDFDHERWTGFALTGKHKALDCVACHAPDGSAAASGNAWGQAKGANCSDCHQEPHRGQFAVRGKTDCARCHRPTVSFVDLLFNHDIHSRFKLGDAHRLVACAVCHRLETGKNSREQDVEFVRYKPIDHKCSDCHGTRGRPFRRRNKKGRRG